MAGKLSKSVTDVLSYPGKYRLNEKMKLKHLFQGEIFDNFKVRGNHGEVVKKYRPR